MFTPHKKKKEKKKKQGPIYKMKSLYQNLRINYTNILAN